MMKNLKKSNYKAIKQKITNPGNEKRNVMGYEYKSKAKIMGLPFLHVSFAFQNNGAPVPAIGFISIGQFGIGVINISQFGIGILSISQFTIAGFAIAQIAFAYSLIAQVGIYIDQGYGQVVRNFAEIFTSF
jgi:hypothetical protein